MMSLADAILKNKPERVLEKLEKGEDINALDEYGFTPLIEACIANNLEMATRLISHGADVKKQDPTGGCPLSWAVENNNLELAQLLLEHGADSNAYTDYAQPILVKPLLRYQYEMKELLYRYDADLNFAQDFINAKLLAHRFGLTGHLHIVSAKGRFIELDFEGFILEFTISVIHQSLIEFRNNFAAKHLKQHFQYLQMVIDGLGNAANLLKYQQYQVPREQYREEIHELLSEDVLILPVGYQGHAITFVCYQDLIARCDRGDESLSWHSVVIYKITHVKKWNKKLIAHILFDKQSKENMTEGIVEHLGLQVIDTLPLPSQISGNCSWANVESVIPALLYMKAMKDPVQTSDRFLSFAKKDILDLYAAWQNWDRNRALHYCIQSFYESSDARKASKASLLGAVLIQMCQDGVPTDLERAGRILSILYDPRFQYVLRAYIKHYTQDKKTVAGKNLSDLIDLVG
jgi:hypothetical protein